MGAIWSIGGGIAAPTGGGGDEHFSTGGSTDALGEGDAVGGGVAAAVGVAVEVGRDVATPRGTDVGVALPDDGGDDEHAAATRTKTTSRRITMEPYSYDRCKSCGP
jgi:hypothetical protein